MATDELTSFSYTCGGSKGTVLVAEWYGTWEELMLHGLALHLVYEGDFPKHMSSSLQIFDNKLVTMEEVKINRFWSKFVVLFIIACYCMSQEFSVQHMN